MRIGVFIYGLTGGGATRRVLTLCKGWKKLGHQVELIVVDPSGPLREETLQAGLNLVPLDFGPWQPMVKKLSRRGRLFLSRFPLARYLRLHPPEILLSGANHAHLAALSARKLADFSSPLVLRISNHLSGTIAGVRGWKRLKAFWRLLWAKRRYPYADFLVAVSQDVLEDLLQRIPFPREKTRVIYNPIDVEYLREKARQPVAHPWLLEKKGPVLLGVGRLSPQKDFATLIKAFAFLKKEIPSARLIVLGEGREKKKLSRLCQKLALSQSVDLFGFTPNPWSFMARADLLILSSRWEGLPGVLLEAMALGCPVVSTDCPGGAREILAHGRYGVLVPVGDPLALAKAMAKTLGNPPPKELLMKRAEEFSVEKAVSAYLTVFEGLRS